MKTTAPTQTAMPIPIFSVIGSPKRSVPIRIAVNGSKTFRGTLQGLEGDEIVILDEAGNALRFDRKAVAVVRPLIEFDEEDLQDDAPAE